MVNHRELRPQTPWRASRVWDQPGTRRRRRVEACLQIRPEPRREGRGGGGTEEVWERKEGG